MVFMRTFFLLLFLFIFSPLTELVAATLPELAKALDLPATVTLVKQTTRIFKVTKEVNDGSVFIDMDEENFTENSTGNWKTLKQEKASDEDILTRPHKGKDFVRSDFTAGRNKSSDGRCTRLHFQVSGPGMFTFWYKTSCDDGDGLRIYVDGEEVGTTQGGYGWWDWDEGWQDTDWELAEIEIAGGLAQDGAYGGTYQHEIIIEFYKDAPQYVSDFYTDKDVYSYDPQDLPKPDSRDYDGDKEWYNADMDKYKASEKWFRNCIYLDEVNWQPQPLELAFLQDVNTLFTDVATIDLSTNAMDFGFRIRYTTDGSAPTASSPEYVMTDDQQMPVIEMTRSGTVKVAVFDEKNRPLNPPVTLEGSFRVQASKPLLALAEQQPQAGELRVTVGLEEGNAGASIHYTIDGRTPTAYSPKVAAGSTLTLREACTVKAISIREGVEPSPVAEFTVSRCEQPTVFVDGQAPQPLYILPESASGVIVAAYKATAATQGTLMYSLNGVAYQPWTGSVTLNSQEAARQTLSVRLEQTGFLPSESVTVSVYRQETFALGEVSPGWNLLCLPYHLTQASHDALLSQYRFYESQPRGGYVQATELREHGVYWLYAEAADSLTDLQGARVTERPTVPKGWSLQGGADTLPGVDSAWHFVEGRWQKAETLTVGRGYFVHCP